MFSQSSESRCESTQLDISKLWMFHIWKEYGRDANAADANANAKARTKGCNVKFICTFFVFLNFRCVYELLSKSISMCYEKQEVMVHPSTMGLCLRYVALYGTALFSGLKTKGGGDFTSRYLEESLLTIKLWKVTSKQETGCIVL